MSQFVLFIIAIVYSKMAYINYGNAIALGYSVTTKNHAITIDIAMTTFSGAMAVLPAAFVPMVQIPIMLLILKLAHRVGGFLGGATEVK